jgi:hypothetical protein
MRNAANCWQNSATKSNIGTIDGIGNIFEDYTMAEAIMVQRSEPSKTGRSKQAMRDGVISTAEPTTTRL